MPLDGSVVKNIVYELNNSALNGRIEKVYQPSRDEIIITVRTTAGNVKLLLSCNPDFPRIHPTESKRENPQEPPMFCMLLRKHISGGRITGFHQPSLERIVEIRVESFGELGEYSEKKIILEIMGKHSNIILVNYDGRIIDSAKRVGFSQSSVREVLPGKPYSYPPDKEKANPLTVTRERFMSALESHKSLKAPDALCGSYCGISPLAAVEICSRAGILPGDYLEMLNAGACERLFVEFRKIMDACTENTFAPEIVSDGGSLLDFWSFELTQFADAKKRRFNEIGALLEAFYQKKNFTYRIKQKTADLRKLLQSNIERCVKKRYILDKTLKDAEGMDEWRLCGELLTAYMSDIPSGAEYYCAQNYHTGEEKRIKLNKDLTPSQNASRYFAKYNRAKRQIAAVNEQLTLNEKELEYLESVYQAVFTDMSEAELLEIREELFAEGYIKKKPIKKGAQKKSAPLHFISTDGFHIYVGKNNRQNDELTLKSNNNDMWFHTKDIPGSHVILKTDGEPPTDIALNEAALLAAFYSRARDGSSVPVDYTMKKYVKKPSGAKPGMVIYDKHKTAYITPEQEIISGIKRIDE